MSRNSIFIPMVLAACFSIGSAGAQEHQHGSSGGVSDTQKAVDAPSAFFDTLKDVMTGSWEGRYANGTFENPQEWMPVRVEYRKTANGTALIEDYLFGEGSSVGMTTVYHQDRNDLRLTHYCGARNHPSMVATKLDTTSRVVQFDFTHITNLKNQDDYHSRQFDLDIVSRDHIKIQYHGLQAGEITSQVYDIRRVGS